MLEAIISYDTSVLWKERENIGSYGTKFVNLLGILTKRMFRLEGYIIALVFRVNTSLESFLKLHTLGLSNPLAIT